MSASDTAAGTACSVSASSSIAATLRLAFGKDPDRSAIVLGVGADTADWHLIAGTRPIPADELAALTAELAAGGCDAVPVCRGTAIAYPLRGTDRLLGALVLAGAPNAVDSGPGGDHLLDVLRCLTDTLEAVRVRDDAAFIARSSRAVRRLFVEGAQAEDVREAGTVLARVAADTFQTERAGMYVVDDAGLISFAVGVGVTADLSDALAVSLIGKVASNSPVWQTLERLGGPDLVDDSRAGRVRPGGFVETMSFQSYVAIPLMSSEGALGMVICGDASRSRAWSARERELANQFALEAALIIDVARLRTAQRAQLALLSHHAHHDGLTGLANRRLLMNRLDEALSAARTSGSTTAMLLLDLNDFKRVNDTLGHRCGDELLREVASRLRGSLREADLLARLGGDEFAIVLSGSSGRTQALAAADRVEAALAEPVVLDGVPVNAVASVGIAVLADHIASAADLLQRADVAMYAAKRARTGPVVYDESMNDATVDRLTLYAELRHAINNGELRLQYQPKLDLRRNVVIGVESLVRWQHPRRGLLMPSEFLPLAESSQLIHPLTAWVVEHSLNQHREWTCQGLDLDLAVNISAHNLQNNELLARVKGLIVTSGVPEKFVIEITETAVMTNPEQSIRALSEIRELGVRISMDDFGTGQSSLALLSQLPVDELKIDRQIVQMSGATTHDRALVDTIVHLGHRLGLTVVGEGIETTETLQSLRDLGCDLGQGYLISPPVGPAELSELAAVRRLALPVETTGGKPAALRMADHNL